MGNSILTPELSNWRLNLSSNSEWVQDWETGSRD